MIEFFQAGGFSMWFILALGLVTCVSGVLYAKARTRPALVRLALFSVATFFAAVAGLASDLATVFMKVPAHPEWSKSPDLHLIVMTGIGESLTPVVLGSALLMIAWTIAAAGHFEFGGRSTGPEPQKCPKSLRGASSPEWPRSQLRFGFSRASPELTP